MPERNSIEFCVWGRYALFTDPLTRIGGEKCTYHIPTYEALKGIAKSIYWKPTIIWVIDEVRVMRHIQTETKGMKPLNYGGIYPSMQAPEKRKQQPFNSLAIYTYLADVEYQVRAHFEWNEHRPELEKDRIEGKHYAIAKRMLERGGRQDIFLGTRDCQGYVKPCEFGSGEGHYDKGGQLAFSLMFHGFDYPDETGTNKLKARFWTPLMENGVIRFKRPGECTISKFIREMVPKVFREGHDLASVKTEAAEIGV